MQKEIEAFLRNLRGLGRSAATIGAYRADLRELRAHCEASGIVELTDIRPDTISDWLASYRDRGCAENTVCRKNAAVRSWFDFCSSRGFAFVKNTAPLIRRNRDQVPRIPTSEEIEAMLATCSVRTTKYVDVRDRAFLLFLWSSGCRRGEAIGLNLEDVKFRRDSGDQQWRADVRVRGKGRKQRIVYLGSRAAEALERYMPLRRPADGDFHHDGVWLSRGGNRLSTNEASALVRKRARDAGIDWQLTTHSLRHAFATQMLRNGADLFALSRMLGHTDLSTTQIYLHLSGDEARAVHAQCDPAAKGGAAST
jgi:integrase/recombinase XerD